MLSGAPISWFSGKQRTVSLSTANAEYIDLSEATREGLFLKQMFSEIGMEIGTVYNARQSSHYCNDKKSSASLEVEAH